MKRHTSLIPLSREHQSALMLVYRLKHGRSSNPKFPWPTDPEVQKEKVLYIFEHELYPHFEAEETCFFNPLLSEVSPQTATLIQQVLNEHLQMQQMINDFALTTDLHAQLKAFGQLLEAHVHTEERQIFEALQHEVPEALLMRLGHQLEKQYTQRPPYTCVFTGVLKQPDLHEKESK